MKSLLLIPVLAFCAIVVRANPIPPPPPISELILNQNGFTLEFALEMWGIEDLDNIRLVTSSGQAYFNPGILVLGELLVVTEEDLQGPLYIDPAGDVLIIEEFYDPEWWELDRISFGNHPDSWVSAPVEGESITRQIFAGPFEHFNWIVKSKPPTPDSLPFWTDSRGTFSGHVLDKNSNGVPYAWIKYCEEPVSGINPYLSTIYADSTGYFFCDNMFAREYNIEVIMYDKVYWYDLINIELDSNNYYEFIIDSLSVGIPEPAQQPKIDIRNYPNPFSNNTTIEIDIPKYFQRDQARITIMDMSGKVVDRIDHLNLNNEGSLKVDWIAPNINSGIYIYNLEIDNKRVASNKMILANE